MKNLFLLLVALSFLFSIPVICNAEEASNTYRLSELIDIAQKQAPVLKMAVSDIDAANGMLEQTRAEISPSMKFSFAYKDFDQKRSGHVGAAPGATQFYSDKLTDSSLQIRQLLLDAGGYKNRHKASKMRSKSALEKYSRIEQELLFNVFSLGITSISQVAKIEAVKQNIEDINAAFQSIKKMEEVGKVAGVDVLRIEFRKQDTFAQLDEAVHQQKALLSKVARIVGLKSVPQAIEKDEDTFQTPQNELSLQKLEQEAFANRPDYQAFVSELKAAGFDVEAARNNLKPQLNFTASINRYGDKTGWGLVNGFAGVEFTWPLSDGGFTRGKIKVAKAMQAKTLEKLNDLTLSIKDQVYVAFSALETAKSKIERSRKGLELAEEAYRIELLTYQNGKGTINDLLDAQSEVFSARARLIQDQNDLIVADLALNLATGKLVFSKN